MTKDHYHNYDIQNKHYVDCMLSLLEDNIKSGRRGRENLSFNTIT